MKIYFIRHGETDENIYEGGSTKLNEEGKKQVKFLVKYLENLDFDLLVSSDLERAQDTAREIQKAKKIKSVKVMPELREIYRGIVGGPKRKEDAPRIREDVKRVEEAWKKIIMLKKKNIAVVCHGNVIRYMLGKTLKIKKKDLWRIVVDNCSVTEMEVLNGKVLVVSVNEHRHIAYNERRKYKRTFIELK